MSEYIGLAEAAAELGLKRDSLKIQAQHGRLRAEKIGRDWIVTRAEVDRYRREVMGTRGRKSQRNGVTIDAVLHGPTPLSQRVSAGVSDPSFGTSRPAPKPGKKGR